MKAILLFACVCWVMAFNLYAQKGSGMRSAMYNNVHGLALKGYDPVAYFLQGKAVKGMREYQASDGQLVYYLSSEANKAMFGEEPYKYAPQYGGWCAYTLATTGKLADIDPNNFKVEDGKLYLLEGGLLKKNPLPRWLAGKDTLIPRADSNWAGILKSYRPKPEAHTFRAAPLPH